MKKHTIPAILAAACAPSLSACASKPTPPPAPVPSQTKTTHISGTTHQNGQSYHTDQTLIQTPGMTTLIQTNKPIRKK